MSPVDSHLVDQACNNRPSHVVVVGTDPDIRIEAVNPLAGHASFRGSIAPDQAHAFIWLVPGSGNEHPLTRSQRTFFLEPGATTSEVQVLANTGQRRTVAASARHQVLVSRAGAIFEFDPRGDGPFRAGRWIQVHWNANRSIAGQAQCLPVLSLRKRFATDGGFPAFGDQQAVISIGTGVGHIAIERIVSITRPGERASWQ